MTISIRPRLNKLRFDWAIRQLASTPPLARGSRPFTALSMVQHRDVLAYLLALKSFARFLPPSEVVLVADPTLNRDDRAMLVEHVPHLQIREAADFHRPGLPRGGTWERLTAIAELAGSAAVVQLDADTVAVARLTDVEAALADGVSFTLGTDDGQRIASCASEAAAARARMDGHDHVQLLAEAQLDRLDVDDRRCYVRGCSGFAGFARGSIDVPTLLEVSARMQALLGDQWSAWGTEQFTSNLLIASSRGARVLPHPRYCAPHRRTAATVFLHFIGYVRYATGLYARLAGDIARDLSSTPPGLQRVA